MGASKFTRKALKAKVSNILSATLAVTVASLSAMFFSNLPVKSCVSLAPADFSNTKGWVGETQKDGKLIHLLGYENTAKNLAKIKGQYSGNAMFLPIPAKPGSMNDKNMLDMSKATHVFEDMELSMQFLRFVRGENASKSFVEEPRVQVFEHGQYTIVLAQHAKDIPDALLRVPEAKRPALNYKIFDAYEKWYPNWTFALCCFSNKEEKTAEPIVWWYEPMHPKMLFFPALDCHTGNVPNLLGTVDVDHFIACSTPKLDELRARYPFDGIKGRVKYKDTEIPENVKALLPVNVIGDKIDGKFANGDFVMAVGDVNNGRFIPRRVLPPGADVSVQSYKFDECIKLDNFDVNSPLGPYGEPIIEDQK